jgi:hypothetical protein
MGKDSGTLSGRLDPALIKGVTGGSNPLRSGNESVLTAGPIVNDDRPRAQSSEVRPVPTGRRQEEIGTMVPCATARYIHII